ncbi:hypothetical protein [Phaffia rhodozyma]|uniref:Uncharacterized protein n=1 Tax=Phaffia rhodozyma TaxID=264483 RepID=A0A0F7SGN2_PHARH|nr:hypothetical protein [Phaffia rhodozyma]
MNIGKVVGRVILLMLISCKLLRPPFCLHHPSDNSVLPRSPIISNLYTSAVPIFHPRSTIFRLNSDTMIAVQLSNLVSLPSGAPPREQKPSRELPQNRVNRRYISRHIGPVIPGLAVLFNLLFSIV